MLGLPVVVCWSPAVVFLTSGLLRDCLAGRPVPRHRSVLVVVVVQVTGATEVSMTAQWHEVLQWHVTCQEGGVLLDGGAMEVGEGSDLTQAVG